MHTVICIRVILTLLVLLLLLASSCTTRVCIPCILLEYERTTLASMHMHICIQYKKCSMHNNSTPMHTTRVCILLLAGSDMHTAS